MELSKTERWILYNQFSILEILDKGSADHYAKVKDVIADGYELEYRYISEHISDEVLSNDDCIYVIDILTMYDDMAYAYEQLSGESGFDADRIKFHGFHGNTEYRFLGYARHLLADKSRFSRLERGDLDSHFPTDQLYRKQLAIWRPIKQKNPLDVGDLRRIVGAPA